MVIQPHPWPYSVPYFPFRDLTGPALSRVESARSILRLYISDLEWMILPEAHRDRDGYTFTNVSYYSSDPKPCWRLVWAKRISGSGPRASTTTSKLVWTSRCRST